MTFSVNLSALRGLPPFLDRRSHDLASAGAYVRDGTILQYGAGLADIFKRHERNVSVVTGYLSSGATRYADADSVHLRQAITNYAAADARAAQRYDATLPMPTGSMPTVPLSATLGPEVFADHASPTASLIKPADHHADFPYHPSWFDLLSPTSMARDLIWKLTSVAARLGVLDRAYDPFEFFVEPYIGDWAGLLRSAEVFDHVADFLAAEAVELRLAEGAIPQVWHGNAAGLCMANIGGFQANLADGSGPLRDLAAVYRGVANGVHDNGEMMATAVTSLFDCAAEAIADVEAGGLLGIYEIGSAIHTFVRALRVALHIAGTLQDLVSTGFNISDEAMHRLGILNTVVTMPAMSGAGPAIPTGP